MPRMDRTGPYGNGLFGRGLGPCGGGLGGWWGGRSGWGMPPAQLTAEEEKKLLEQQRSWLQSRLDLVNQRLQGLDKPAK